MHWVRLASLFASAALFAGCVQAPLAVEPSEKPHLCEIHRVPTVKKAMPETPLSGFDDNGYHPETKPYFDAMEKRFPYVGFNGPSCCGYHGGEIHHICPECVKAEDAWVARHPRVPSPVYGSPDVRRE